MSLDIAIDLGTSRTRIFLGNKGIVLDEPSVITVNLENDDIIAVGEAAYPMLGRTSERLSASYPLVGGVISDLGLVEAMIGVFLKRVVSTRIGMPRVVACVPGEITEVEKRAVVNAISNAGIRKVCLIEETVAAAMGAGLDIYSPHGSLVVDVGGGTTDMAVISLSGIAVSRSIKLAGNKMDEEIIKFVKKNYNILIGKRTAEQMKIAIGCVAPGIIDASYRLKGRNAVTGMPMAVEVTAEAISYALQDVANGIVHEIENMLEETPPELIGDIHSDGMVLTGGCAQIPGLAELIRQTTKLRVEVAEDSSTCVIRGCGKALKYIDALGKNDRGGMNPISDVY